MLKSTTTKSTTTLFETPQSFEILKTAENLETETLQMAGIKD